MIRTGGIPVCAPFYCSRIGGSREGEVRGDIRIGGSESGGGGATEAKVLNHPAVAIGKFGDGVDVVVASVGKGSGGARSERGAARPVLEIASGLDPVGIESEAFGGEVHGRSVDDLIGAVESTVFVFPASKAITGTAEVGSPEFDGGVINNTYHWKVTNITVSSLPIE